MTSVPVTVAIASDVLTVEIASLKRLHVHYRTTRIQDRSRHSLDRSLDHLRARSLRSEHTDAPRALWPWGVVIRSPSPPSGPAEDDEALGSASHRHVAVDRTLDSCAER